MDNNLEEIDCGNEVVPVIVPDEDSCTTDSLATL